MSDLISRQATIEWLKNEWNGMVTSLFDGIKTLPSAQPERTDCTECEEYDSETKSCPKYCEVIRKTLEEAKQERTGRWLPDNRPGGGFWVCSCCKFPSEAFAADKLYKYCPVCGARMEEKDEAD